MGTNDHVGGNIGGEHERNIKIATRPLTAHSTRAGGRSYVQISVY